MIVKVLKLHITNPPPCNWCQKPAVIAVSSQTRQQHHAKQSTDIPFCKVCATRLSLLLLEQSK